MLSIISFAAFAALGNLIFGSAAQTIDTTQVSVNSVSYGGTGCPQGSLNLAFSPTRQSFVALFDSYTASLGPAVAVDDNRKNCQINIDLLYPKGWQYTVSNYSYAGNVDIDAGVNATHKTTYYFSGQTAQTSTSHDFVGPIDAPYGIADTIAAADRVWSPCASGLPLNINTQVRLTSANATATGTIQEAGLELVQFVWRQC